MKNNTLEAFKKAIKEKYEVEKLGVNAPFLLQPSRAKLRDFCFELLKENPNEIDLMCFKSFLGFEFNPNNANKLKALTDKFRPLETFFKGETALSDLASANMAAVLVDFTPRPYLKFCRLEHLEITFPAKKDYSEKKTISIQNNHSQVAHEMVSIEAVSQKTPYQKHLLFKKTYIFVLPILLCVFGFLGYKAFNKKECMQWNADHYEVVSCHTDQGGLLQPTEKIPLNETLLALQKIVVSDTTAFFKNDVPQVWYSKRNKKVEFFNGPGFHPESHKALKPITNYMIKKYVLKKETIPNDTVFFQNQQTTTENRQPTK